MTENKTRTPIGAVPTSSRTDALTSPREVFVVVCILSALLSIAYSNVVFAAKSLVYTDNFNPLDARPMAQNIVRDG